MSAILQGLVDELKKELPDLPVEFAYVGSDPVLEIKISEGAGSQIISRSLMVTHQRGELVKLHRMTQILDCVDLNDPDSIEAIIAMVRGHFCVG